MAGIVFLKTSDRAGAVAFYENALGMNRWLEQPDISILRHGNLLVGFVQVDTYVHQDDGCLITVFLNERADVDRLYRELKERAEAPPQDNPRYQIYNFYARDPEGRRFEVQTFLHDLPSWNEQV
ncbi:MAG: VOC family protein [Spirochaetaceae bacterium]|nr:MAG: VOC family protein [Spirochaetaceae bacterium]